MKIWIVIVLYVMEYGKQSYKLIKVIYIIILFFILKSLSVYLYIVNIRNDIYIYIVVIVVVFEGLECGFILGNVVDGIQGFIYIKGFGY